MTSLLCRVPERFSQHLEELIELQEAGSTRQIVAMLVSLNVRIVSWDFQGA